MGPLDVVLAKAALCEALERTWSARSAPERVQKILRCADERDLEAAYRELGLEMMERGRRAGAAEFVEIWKSAISGAAGAEADEDVEGAPKGGLASGLAKGIGKAFARSEERGTTTSELAAGASTEGGGPATSWGDEDSSVVGASPAGLSIELAKAELAAIARSRLGPRADKIVDLIEESTDPGMLSLAVGEAQRKLVKAGMPRLAAKMAKKWQELRWRVS